MGKIAIVAAGLRPQHATTMRENAKTVLREQTFEGVEPAVADHFADETAHYVDLLLAGIEEKVKAAYQAPPG